MSEKCLAIRLGHNRTKVHLISDNGFGVQKNQKLVFMTESGLELGHVVNVLNNDNHGKDLSGYVNSIVRIASIDDINTYKNNITLAKDMMLKANNIATDIKSDIVFIDSKLTLNGNKIIFTYVNDGRVDFRELVKLLANKFKIKIELKQISSRDKAREVGGIGSCGKVSCCKVYLNDDNKVSIKMAKTQNLSLVPSKISGICGKLMCCLSYENSDYESVSKQMPKVTGIVTTPDGQGTVVFNNLLKEIVTVKLYDNEKQSYEFKEYSLKEISFNKTADISCKG